MTVFAIVFGSEPVTNYLRTQLADLASHGLLTAIDTRVYRDLSQGNRGDARRIVKDFTRHNDKLGFDYSNKDRKYKADLSPQFEGSAYPEFLVAAANFYNR